MSATGLAERWDPVRGLRIRSLAIGDPEGPLVILVHGLGLAGASMADMARHLARSTASSSPTFPASARVSTRPAP